MKEKNVVKEKRPFYKRVIGIGIMLAVAVYCIPELQEKVLTCIDYVKNGRWEKK